ncbi:MAG: hypothetical protein JWN15_2710 [Firmicutes bacterium]|nr:hypothetical protein [Bacillota bacterium]
MTQQYATGSIRDLRRAESAPRSGSPLTLRQTVPADWHRDQPAFAGDPFMDWESLPEPPKSARWTLVESWPGH